LGVTAGPGFLAAVSRAVRWSDSLQGVVASDRGVAQIAP